jgi:hypothetical protein
LKLKKKKFRWNFKKPQSVYGRRLGVLPPRQGDQIGRNFAIWAIFMAKFFLEKIAQ